MIPDELKKEAEEWIAEYTGIDVETQRAIRLQYHDNLRNAYIAGAEPREKRIAELEAQIEKMKCCGNCAKNGHICVAEEMQGKLCGKNKDKWELRR